MPNPDTITALSLPRSSWRDLVRLWLLESEVATLRATVADLQAINRHRLPIAARESSADLLREVLAFVHGNAFVTADCFRFAGLQSGFALQAALTACGCSNGRSLGKLLSAIQGHVIDGLCVETIGEDNAGLIWKVSIRE